jgi:hypothetical protein
VRLVLYPRQFAPGPTTHPLLVATCVHTGKVLESTLFRGNDIASHLLSVYCQIVGKAYLVETLHHLIELVVDIYAKGKSLEGAHTSSSSLACLRSR